MSFRKSSLFIALYILVIIVAHIIQFNDNTSSHRFELTWFDEDNLPHFLIFLPWMSLVRYHLSRLRLDQGRKYPGFSRSPVYWFFLGILLAVVAESLQIWVPSRTFNVMDILSNVAGVVVGCVVYLDKLVKR